MAGQIKAGDIVYVRGTSSLLVVVSVDGGVVTFNQSPYSAELDECTLVSLQENDSFDLSLHPEFVKLLGEIFGQFEEIKRLRRRLEDLIKSIVHAQKNRQSAQAAILEGQLHLVEAEFNELLASTDAALNVLFLFADNMATNLPDVADSVVLIYGQVLDVYFSLEKTIPVYSKNVLETSVALTNRHRNRI